MECGCHCEDGKPVDLEHETDYCPKMKYSNTCICKEGFIRKGCDGECIEENTCDVCIMQDGIRIDAGGEQYFDKKTCKKYACKKLICCEVELQEIEPDVCEHDEHRLECNEGEEVSVGEFGTSRTCNEHGFVCEEVKGKIYVGFQYNDSNCCGKCMYKELSKKCEPKVKMVPEIELSNGCISQKKNFTITYCGGNCASKAAPRLTGEFSITMKNQLSFCECCAAVRPKMFTYTFECRSEDNTVNEIMSYNLISPEGMDPDDCNCVQCKGDAVEEELIKTTISGNL